MAGNTENFSGRVQAAGEVQGATVRTGQATVRPIGVGTPPETIIAPNDITMIAGVSALSGTLAANNGGCITASYGIRAEPRITTATTDTLALDDDGQDIYFTGTANTTVTVPLNASVAFPVGATINIGNYTSAKKLVLSVSGITVVGNARVVSNEVRVYPGTVARLIKTATNSWLIQGAEEVVTHFRNWSRTQSITNGSVQSITWTGATSYPSAWWSSGATFTTPDGCGGMYLIDFQMSPPNSVSYTRLFVDVVVNSVGKRRWSYREANVADCNYNYSTVLDLLDGDAVRFDIYQTSAATRSILFSVQGTRIGTNLQ